jgi:hypothetical protein
MPEQQPILPIFNTEDIEREIEAHRKVVDYNIIEYPIEVIVQKYLGPKEEDQEGRNGAEFYIPDYQREHTWDEKRKSKFIESVLIGLPIPFLFLAEEIEEKDKTTEGRLEVVDGSQRIRTLSEFLTGGHVLGNLEKLPLLNGCRFSDLSLSRQRKFNRATIRIIALSAAADEETRRDLFERINTGSDPLKNMEQRRGIMRGPFLKVLEECAQDPIFNQLAPLSESYVKRREREEYVLRFFAYLERYLSFDKSVKDFLDQFVDEKNADQNLDNYAAIRGEFDRMLAFVKQHFRFGFRRANYKTAKRVRFEAISVGVALALRERPDLTPASPTDSWSETEEFHELTASDSSNSKPKVKARIEYVRDKLLNG